MVKLGSASPDAWSVVTSLMEIELKDIDFQADDILLNWKDGANKRRYERELYDRYGPFKDIILHPTYQSLKTKVEENMNTDVVLGDPLIPFATAVIVLFMLHKRVDNTVLTLAAAFLFNLNPFYVAVVVLLMYFQRRTKKPKQHIKTNSRDLKKYANYKSYTVLDYGDSNFQEKNEMNESFDHILIGNDISTLFTAALLSKNGHKCCVLQAAGAPCMEICPEGTPTPAPVRNLSIGKVDRYQYLLDLATGDDDDNRIKFSPIGEESTGYTSTILKVNTKIKKTGFVFGPGQGLWSLRPGESSLIKEFATCLAIDSTPLISFIKVLMEKQNAITQYLITKVVPVGQMPLERPEPVKQFGDISSKTVNDILSSIEGLDNEDVIEALSTTAVAGVEEALSSIELSGILLPIALSMSDSGLFYPVGGYKKIEEALARSIRRIGGSVIKNVPIININIDGTGSNARANGVIVGSTGELIKCQKSIISGLGVLNTYTRLIASNHVPASVRSSLCQLTEARPKAHVIHWVQGNASSLGLKACDYVETGSHKRCVEIPSEVNTESFAQSYCKIWCPSVKDPSWVSTYGDKHVIIVELELGSPAINLKSHLFNSSDEFDDSESDDGPKMFTCDAKMIFSECAAGTAISLSRSQNEKCKSLALQKLLEVYPLVQGSISAVYVSPPIIGGHSISNNTYKYSSSISATSDIKGLYFCGRDITTYGLAGEIQGGVVATHAVLGYSYKELLSNRNIVTDMTHT